MSGLLHLLRLTQDAAGTARSEAQIATENLTGSRDPKYVKRTVDIEVDVVGGRLGGLRTGTPHRVIDEKIINAKRDQHSTVAFNEIKREFLELFDDLNGALDAKGSIDQKLLTLAQKAASLTVEAGSPILRGNTIESMKEFLTTIRSFANGINIQRNAVERDIMSSVKEVEELSERLFRLNQEIASAAYSGQDLSNLESVREDVVEKISTLMNVQILHSETNIFIYTSSGKALVEYKAYPLTYTSNGIIDYSASYPANINPINLRNDAGVNVDVTTELTGGKIGAYLELRDRIYPQYQESIDHFTQMLQHHANRIHNQGVGFPPPTELNGQFFVTDATKNTSIPWKADSVVRLALVDAQGRFADSGGTFHLDLNLNPGGAGGLTPIEIRDAINTAFGAGTATFSEGDYGYLTLSAPAGLRIALGSVDGSTPGETTTDVGFSEYFKLNDLLRSSPDPAGRGVANSITLHETVSLDASLFAIGKLNTRNDIALAGSMEQMMGVTSGDGTNLSALRELINSPVLIFAGAGGQHKQTLS